VAAGELRLRAAELAQAVRIAREEGLSRFDERWMGLA
jgi:hypothetical protein